MHEYDTFLYENDIKPSCYYRNDSVILFSFIIGHEIKNVTSHGNLKLY